MSLFEKLKKFPKRDPKKLFETLTAVVVASMVTMGAVYDTGLKEVTIMRTDMFAGTAKTMTVTTRGEKVSDIFGEEDISIGSSDIAAFSMEDEISDGDVLEIKRGKKIKITADGIARSTVTSRTTVAEALLENGITIGADDWAEPGFETPITEGMEITLYRITVREETVTEKFSGPVENRTDDGMYVDEKKVIKGADGIKEVSYKVMDNEGNEVYREVLSENVLKEPETTTVITGTRERLTATKQGRTFTYSKKLTVNATAYDTSPEENGGYCTTATGMALGYGMVAVDPRVIPLGSRLYIESTDEGGSWTYGYAVAGDTGGAIKGNRIDLCYNTKGECIRFGRRKAVVYVLD